MISKTKTILFALIFFSIVIIIGLIIYFSAKSKKDETKQFSNIQNSLTAQIILNEKIFLPFLKPDNNSLVFLGDKGIIFFSYNINGKQKNKIYDNEVLGAQSTYYSPSGSKAIVKSIINNNIENKSYDFIAKNSHDLNGDANDFVWLNENKIAYSFFDKKNSKFQISQANADGTNWQKIIGLDMNEGGYNLAKKNESEIYYYPAVSDQRGVNVYKLNIPNKKSDIIISDNRVLNPVFSVDGAMIVYQKLDSKNYNSLPIVYEEIGKNNSTVINYPIDLSATIWSNNHILYSIFKNDTDYVLYQNDINNKKEALYKINGLNVSENVQNLMLSSDNKTLYFTQNDYLYKMTIN